MTISTIFIPLDQEEGLDAHVLLRAWVNPRVVHLYKCIVVLAFLLGAIVLGTEFKTELKWLVGRFCGVEGGLPDLLYQ
jgi:hypothetical protein